MARAESALTDVQRATLTSIRAIHTAVRWHPMTAPECARSSHQAIFVQWRHHQAVRSQIVFADGHRGPLGESATFQ